MDHMWPTEPHPLTKEPFTACLELTAETEVHEHHTLPPEPPSRVQVLDWDDEGCPIEERELSDEEFAEAERVYEKARESYRETKGLVRTAGRSSVTGKFATASGAQCEGQADSDGRWVWATMVS